MNQVSSAIQERVAAFCSGGVHTRTELAALMSMPYSTFISKLNGPSEFSFSEGIRLAEAMQISPDMLATSVTERVPQGVA